MTILDDYISAKKPLKYWEEILYEWTFLVHRIYRVSNKKTSVHAEKERANTGLIAAAATRNGWLALEERRTEKNHITNDGTYYGRCDLVLWRGNIHHEIEAKFMRVPLRDNWESKITDTYKKARDDSSRSTASGYKFEKNSHNLFSASY